MSKRIFPLAAIVCAIGLLPAGQPSARGAGSGTATTPSASAGEPSVNVEAILAALKTIREKQTETQKSQKTRLIQDLQTRAANPATALEFYEAAVKATQFDGENHAQTQFIEWKKKEAAHLKGRDFQNGLRLHLNYLVLTLQRGAGTEVKALLPALVACVQQVRVELDSGNQDGILRGSLGDSIFVRWYQAGSWINGIDGWELTPGNVDGIYSKTIQPEFRRLKDPRIVEYWDARIQREAGQAAKSNLSFDAGKFDQVRKPALLWSRAEDVLSIGQKNRAAADMFALIKNYPTHPDALKWVAQLESVLAGKPEAAGGAAAPVQ